MSKKINFGTISEYSLGKLSDYNKAIVELKKLRTEYNKKKEVLQTEKNTILKNRKNAMAEKKLTTDEIIQLYSIEDVDKRLREAEEDFSSSCKPYNEAKKKATSLVGDDIYHAYMLAREKDGNTSATGELSIKKKNSTEIFKVEKSFKDIIIEFLDTIGCRNQDNQTALDKFVQAIIFRTSGDANCNRGTALTKVKTSGQFKDIFMRVFIDYVTLEKGVITVNEDNTLSMTVYEN